jgi:NDP-sugar pyrophosphorylase family protein
MNGDLLTTLDYGSLVEAHKRTGAAATISVCRREVPIDFGVVETDEASTLERYIEKPVYRFDVSMGINVLKTSAVRPHLHPGEPLDLPSLMMTLRDGGHLVHCFFMSLYWLDVDASTTIRQRRRSSSSAGPIPAGST